LRLSDANSGLLPDCVKRPGYDRQSQRRGIVHLGAGAFHRAHQACYTDAAMAAGDRDWAITGVSMRSPQARDAIAPQDGLFTLTEREEGGARIRIIGALREILVAPGTPQSVIGALSDPGTHLVTLTVTEKGYCRLPDGKLDVVRAADPASLYSDVQRDAIAAQVGMRDEGAVITEPFSQWVIEDRFAGPRPRWEVAGAQFVSDVRPYEDAKLRMLNGAHSALAYLGLAAGHRHVHEAIADPAIRPLVERLMRDEAAASLDPAPGQDLSLYADRLLGRFANPALPHRLSQIATDGSQKIGPRWLAQLAVNDARGHTCPATLQALAAWILHMRGDRDPVDDPMRDEIADLWRSAGSAGVVDGLFGPAGLFAATWTASAAAAAILRDHVGGATQEGRSGDGSECASVPVSKRQKVARTVRVKDLPS